MTIYVMNDDHNSFDHVIYILQKTLPMCNTLRAEQIARLVHESGKCDVFTGFPPEVYILYAQLQKMGLTVQLKIDQKSK